MNKTYNMKKTIRLSESELTKILRRVVNESSLQNELGMFEYNSKKIIRAIYELVESKENGNTEMTSHLIDVLLRMFTHLETDIEGIKKELKKNI